MKPALSVRLGVPVASAALTLILALMRVAALGDDARAQTTEEARPQPPPAAEKLPVEDFSKPMGPPACSTSWRSCGRWAKPVSTSSATRASAR